MVRTTFIALATAFLLAALALASITYERPGIGQLACTNAAGRLTTGDDFKECHPARNVYGVILHGF